MFVYIFSVLRMKSSCTLTEDKSPRVEKVHDMFFLWDTKREEIDQFFFRSKQAQSDHKIYSCIIREGNKFPRHYYHKKLLRSAILQRNWDKDSISDSHTHFQPTETFQYREPPLISYRRGKSLIDIIVRAKL